MKDAIQSTLLFVAQKGWQQQSDDFFTALVRHLTETLGVDYALIDRLCEDDPGIVETVAVHANGKVVGNLRYPLQGTPCENVFGKTLCAYPQGVSQLFPQDALLTEMEADSYIGIPLWSSDGGAIGLIAVLNRGPMVDPKVAEAVLQIVAVRAAAEIEYRAHTEKIERQNESLRRSVEKLTEANAELERFAYVASHDLQEPLRGIISFVELLESRHGDLLAPEVKEYFGFISDNAYRMRALVQDVLAYSRGGRGAAPLDPIDLSVAVQAALDDLRTAIKEAGAVVEVEPLPTIKGDRARLSVLFQNLIGNAIKYAKPGVAPRIRIGCHQENGDLVIWVDDNGIGIAPEYREQIFEVFARLHGPNDYPGTGIGLAICRRIATSHGGRIWVEDGTDGGSRFKVALPAGRTV